MPRRQESTQSHTEDLRDLPHGMHPGHREVALRHKEDKRRQ